MAISYVGAAKGTTSATLPSFQSGDVALVVAGGLSAMSPPAGWNLHSSYGAGPYGYLAWKVLQDGDTSTGTWTNAWVVAVVVYRGVHPFVPIGIATNCLNNSGTSLVIGRNAYSTGYANTLNVNIAVTTSATNIGSQSLTNWTKRGSTSDVLVGDSTEVNAASETINWTPTSSNFLVNTRLMPDTAVPVVADIDTTSGTQTSNSSSWTLTYPTNITAGDLLLAFVAMDGDNRGTGPGGSWVAIASSAETGAAVSQEVWGVIAAGTETGTFSFSLAGSEQGAWMVIRIPAGTWYGVGVGNNGTGTRGATVGGGGTSQYPDPPTVSAWDGSLIFAMCAVDTSRTVTGYPTDFTNTGYLASGGSTGSTLGWARSESIANPGTFTIATSDDWAVATIAVRGRQYFSVYGQAQVQIAAGGATSYKVSGQAQVGIKQTYPVYGQAQARIKQTYPRGGGSYTSTILADSPMGYWPLDDTGTAIDDISTGNHDATATNCTVNESPLIATGKSIKFNGTSSQIKMNNSFTFNFSSNIFAIEAWVKTDSPTGTMSIFNQSGGTANPALKIDSNGTLRSVAHGTQQIMVSPSSYITSGSIYHIVWVKNGSTNLMYVNGVDKTSDFTITDYTFPVNGAGDSFIGISSDGASEWFKGWIDEVALYPSAISGSRVLAHYNAGLSGDVIGPTFAQAQGKIQTTSLVYAQSNAKILGVGKVSGQAQVWIKQQSLGYAQGQTRIKTTYNGYGQAQVWVKVTRTVYAGTAVWIKATSLGYANAQVKIKQTYQVSGQAQVALKATSQTFGQAQAKIVGIDTYQVSGQAQAQIISTQLGFAQAQVWIKNTYQVFGQSQVQILVTSAKYAQAQAQIKVTFAGYGQAQVWIKQAYRNSAQSQAQIKVTNQIVGQAQAWVKQTYLGAANAQAKISATGYGIGQTQVEIYIPQIARPISDISNDGWVGTVRN